MDAFDPKVVCFSCDFGWGFVSGHEALSPLVENWIPVTCSSKVDSVFILEAFEKGADGVLILGCPEGRCHFEDGNFRTEKKVYLLQKVLETYGIERERLRMVLSNNPEGERIPELVGEMKQALIKLGPIEKR
jgi:F420-non-reducing hydrogenase iron-sulfur subunit